MGAKFTLNAADAKRIEERIKALPGNAEKAINNYLKEEGREVLIQGVTMQTPMSRRKKKHAKNSKPYTGINTNLAVTICSKSAYSYLYFPDTGAGTSKYNPRNAGFMQEGVESVYNQVVNGLLRAIEKEI